ncbi:MAG TPA: hypothetical protein VJV03_13100 [Pyrinomonadaceae bacterium]|nr:hypothetical protein [Pyrinomonadaceae bacterium]
MIQLRTLQILIKPILLIALFAVCTLPVLAQRRTPGPGIVDASNKNVADEQQLSPIEEEMRAKRQIEASDKAHKENVNRARHLVSLSESLVRAYKTNKHLGKEDLKNLERAEKLVKKIRDDAGGSDPDTEEDEGPQPRDLPTGLAKLLELADSLKERVEKTPKHVLSAAIIDEANVLLELIRSVRLIQSRTT